MENLAAAKSIPVAIDVGSASAAIAVRLTIRCISVACAVAANFSPNAAIVCISLGGLTGIGGPSERRSGEQRESRCEDHHLLYFDAGDDGDELLESLTADLRRLLDGTAAANVVAEAGRRLLTVATETTPG